MRRERCSTCQNLSKCWIWIESFEKYIDEILTQVNGQLYIAPVMTCNRLAAQLKDNCLVVTSRDDCCIPCLRRPHEHAFDFSRFSTKTKILQPRNGFSSCDAFHSFNMSAAPTEMEYATGKNRKETNKKRMETSRLWRGRRRRRRRPPPPPTRRKMTQLAPNLLLSEVYWCCFAATRPLSNKTTFFEISLNNNFTFCERNGCPTVSWRVTRVTFISDINLS